MGKIAFVFSGQGDQFPGMGKDLYDTYPSAKAVFDLCDTIRPETSAQCFRGTEEELKETKNTQPCLFAMELALCAVLSEHGISPDAVAGFSLGEVAACTAAGVFDMQTGFHLVCRRGELMGEAAEKIDASMAAVVKLSTEKVEELCGKYTAVYPVNFNCPGQITVAGLSAEMISMAADVKAAGGRAIPLKVGGGFHSPFMKDAATAFAEALASTDIQDPTVTLYSNMTGKPYTEDVRHLLSMQICHPVRWEDTIREMIAEGIDTFVEIGPGKTLTNLIGKINAGVNAYSASELSKVLSEVCHAEK